MSWQTETRLAAPSAPVDNQREGLEGLGSTSRSGAHSDSVVPDKTGYAQSKEPTIPPCKPCTEPFLLLENPRRTTAWVTETRCLLHMAVLKIWRCTSPACVCVLSVHWDLSRSELGKASRAFRPGARTAQSSVFTSSSDLIEADPLIDELNQLGWS